ncbi:MAG: hypothetical protein IJZ17_02700 [Muribaculaceae bacterium]|nr:hypothetical protein [Muribaculaceae bacterium]
MSKVYDENVRKALAVAEGVRRNLEVLSQYGITEQQVDALIAVANDTGAKSAEVDELRKIVAEKASVARVSLDSLTVGLREIKQVIKRNFEQPKWIDFGIEDKR